MYKRGCKTDQFKYINCVQSELSNCTYLSKKVRVSSSVALINMASPISLCDEDEETLLVGHGEEGGG